MRSALLLFAMLLSVRRACVPTTNQLSLPVASSHLSYVHVPCDLIPSTAGRGALGQQARGLQRPGGRQGRAAEAQDPAKGGRREEAKDGQGLQVLSKATICVCLLVFFCCSSGLYPSGAQLCCELGGLPSVHMHARCCGGRCRSGGLAPVQASLRRQRVVCLAPAAGSEVPCGQSSAWVRMSGSLV